MAKYSFDSSLHLACIDHQETRLKLGKSKYEKKSNKETSRVFLCVCALFNYASMDKLFIFESSEQKTFVFLEAAHLHTNGKFGKSPLVLKHARRRARYA